MSGAEPQVYTVSQLTAEVRAAVEKGVGSVWVEGEISNFRPQPSGHVYFTLKDERAQLGCVMWRGGQLGGGAQHLGDGRQVQLYGALTVYEARGQYQMNVRLAQPRGRGALQAKFDALKAKLAAEGLFDPARKKPLPRFPRAVGLITSATGAALQDMLNIFTRRAPFLRLLVHPVRVQGVGAAAEIAAAVESFNAWSAAGRADLAVDVIVVGRGGGSLEDLWEFNEEIVARAVAASVLPIVSAVGHEIDFTICDFAADLRAPTPSAAAELIAPDAAELLARIGGYGDLLRRALRDWVERARDRLDYLGRGDLHRAPRRRLEEEQQRLDGLAEELHRSVRARLDAEAQRLARLSAAVQPHTLAARLEAARHALDSLRERLRTRPAQRLSDARAALRRADDLLRVLGPRATLERGWTFTTDATGEPVRGAAEVRAGMTLVTHFADGEARSVAEKL